VEGGEGIGGGEAGGRAVESRHVFRLGLDALGERVEVSAAQLVQQQLRVGRLILEEEHAQGGRHQTFRSHLRISASPQYFGLVLLATDSDHCLRGRVGGRPGGWLSRTQYRPSSRTAPVNCSKCTGLTQYLF